MLRSAERCAADPGAIFHGSRVCVALLRAAPRPGRERSIVEAAGAAAGLDVAATLLAFEAALFGAEGRLGRTARCRADERLAEQLQQTIDGIGAVALLGTEALGVDHDH